MRSFPAQLVNNSSVVYLRTFPSVLVSQVVTNREGDGCAKINTQGKVNRSEPAQVKFLVYPPSCYTKPNNCEEHREQGFHAEIIPVAFQSVKEAA